MSVLKQPILVLNKNWTPISTVTVEKALTMLFGEWCDDKGQPLPKAKILDIESWLTYDWASWSELRPRANEAVVRASQGQEFKVPEIIIVTRYHKIPKNQLSFNRRNLFRRDCNQCQFCRCKPGTENLSIDHVIPRCKGGKTNWENCVVACFKCNQQKRDRTPQEAGMSLIREPCKPGLEILGNSEIRMKSWEVFFGKNVDDLVSEAYWSVPLE